MDKSLMQEYEMIEHTADIAIRAFGRDTAELFSNAARGMSAYIFGPEVLQREPEGSESINVESLDLDSLLVDWLSEILFLSASKYRAYVAFAVAEISSSVITAEGTFCKADAVNDIKAVTYHGLKIERVSSLWRATVIYDI
ncbi:MAG: archease [Deltaproteobacteria bacterium]|nr:archease [Deltaproteobacteria bacterium]